MHQIIDLDHTITLFLNGSDSLLLDGAMWMATQTLTWIPLGLLILWICYYRGGWKLLLFVLAAILIGICISDQLSSSVVKPLVKRFRPTQDPVICSLVDTVNGYRGGLYGFFSAHASNTFTVATLLTLLFRQRIATFSLYSWAILNCYTRIYLGVHYFGDILVGSLIGIAIGHLCYHLLLRFMPQLKPDESHKPEQTPSGFSHKLLYMLTSCILVSYSSLFILPYLFNMVPYDKL